MLCNFNASFRVLSLAHVVDINYRSQGSMVGLVGAVGIAGPGIESRRGGEIFRTRPERPCCPPNHLYSGYRPPRRSIDHPPKLCFLYFRNFSSSFLITFLCSGIAPSIINMYVACLLSRIVMSLLLLLLLLLLL